MYERRTLKNGVRILHELMDGVRSVSIGVWIMNGSRNEPKALGGISHFIEHMVFKGTDSRSSADIAGIMDGIGGQVNAFTTKECTCFYARVLDTHIRLVTEVLADMIFHSKFDENDVSTERGVILEEIGMYSDSPEDLASELHSASIFKGDPLARPILGTKKTLERMTGQTLRDYLSANYLPSEILISVSGNYSQGDIDYIESLFSDILPVKRSAPKPSVYRQAFAVKKKKTEQNHIILGFDGPCQSSPDRFAYAIMSNILGGGMSSRLFQKVREERGLCYSIYSFMSAHIEAGVFGVYTATNKESEMLALKLIRDEIERFILDGVTEEELTRSREQCKANVLLSLESSSSRMNRLARGELFSGEILTPDEIAAAYDSVTRERILELARHTLNSDLLSLSAVGKVEPSDAYIKILKQ